MEGISHTDGCTAETWSAMPISVNPTLIACSMHVGHAAGAVRKRGVDVVVAGQDIRLRDVVRPRPAREIRDSEVEVGRVDIPLTVHIAPSVSMVGGSTGGRSPGPVLPGKLVSGGSVVKAGPGRPEGRPAGATPVAKEVSHGAVRR